MKIKLSHLSNDIDASNIQYTGIVDSSGIKITYLEAPREYDAGILLISHNPSQFLIIPPNTTNYTISALCSADYTKMVHKYLFLLQPQYNIIIIMHI